MASPSLDREILLKGKTEIEELKSLDEEISEAFASTGFTRHSLPVFSPTNPDKFPQRTAWPTWGEGVAGAEGASARGLAVAPPPDAKALQPGRQTPVRTPRRTAAADSSGKEVKGPLQASRAAGSTQAKGVPGTSGTYTGAHTVHASGLNKTLAPPILLRPTLLGLTRQAQEPCSASLQFGETLPEDHAAERIRQQGG